MTATKRRIDFTNTKEGSGINPTNVEDGDYLGKIVQVVDQEAKDGEPMWLFTIQLADRKSAIYPYYCKLVENQLWKLRNLLVAAGKTVPKKAVNVDPNTVVGQNVGMTLETEEYEGKLRSVIVAIFPASELEGDDEVVEELEEDEALEEEAPKKKPARKAKPAPVDDEDDEELDLDDL